jgi:hypothetical protein
MLKIGYLSYNTFLYYDPDRNLWWNELDKILRIPLKRIKKRIIDWKGSK